MPNRNELNLRAVACGFDPSTIPNDSKLEQKILFLEKNGYAVTGSVPTTTLTSSGTAGNGETLTLGTTVYTFKTALTEVFATGTITSTGTIPNDGDIIQIGQVTYILKTTLDTGTTLAQVTGGTSNIVEVLINSSAANMLTNLKAAINASGTPGTDYTSNVVIHPTATAGTKSGTQLVVTDKLRSGTDLFKGYSTSTTVSKAATTLSWGAPALTGGVNPVANEVLIGAGATNSLDNIKDAINSTALGAGPGVGYSSTTLRNQQLTAGTKNATTVVISSTDIDASGLIATTETMANFALTATTLTGGVIAELAVPTAGTSGTKDTLAGVAGDRNTSL